MYSIFICMQFFSVLRPKDKSRTKTTKGRIAVCLFFACILNPDDALYWIVYLLADRLVPHPPLHPAGSVESIAHALNRIAQRQNARKYAARRPVVSALKAASQPSMATDRTPSQESSQEQPSADCDVLAANSNSSNSQDYVTPVPSYGTKVRQSYEPSSAISESASTWRDSPFYPSNAQSAVSQVTPISTNTWTDVHSGTPNSSSRQSFNKYHRSVPHTNSKRDISMSADTAKHHYGTPASLDLLHRIQLHNKAISRYIEMQRQHQTPPLSVHQPISLSTNPSSLCSTSKKQPTPTSSEYHSTSAPSFKFVVPHPPSTPKPNFMAGTHHRGVIRTTPISMWFCVLVFMLLYTCTNLPVRQFATSDCVCMTLYYSGHPYSSSESSSDTY